MSIAITFALMLLQCPIFTHTLIRLIQQFDSSLAFCKVPCGWISTLGAFAQKIHDIYSMYTIVFYSGALRRTLREYGAWKLTKLNEVEHVFFLLFACFLYFELAVSNICF